MPTYIQNYASKKFFMHNNIKLLYAFLLLSSKLTQAHDVLEEENSDAKTKTIHIEQELFIIQEAGLQIFLQTSKTKDLFELEFTNKKPENPINLDHWAKTGQFHPDEKKVYFGEVETRFGTISIQRTFSTITEPSKQTQGPS